MHEALLEAGVTSRFVIVPGAEHGFVDEEVNQAMEKLVNWFEQYLLVD